MTDPLDSNDDWADLARELERDKPPAPTTPPADMVGRQIEAEAVEPHHGDPRAEDEAMAEGEPEAEGAEEFDDAEEGSPSEAGEPAGEGEQPGTGRKRRRRRRRRRKGGAPGEGTVAAAALEESESEAIPEGEAEDEAPVEAAPEGEDFDADYESESRPLAAEEDTASDVLRELIANWNVPSWDDIVGGLYRPN